MNIPVSTNYKHIVIYLETAISMVSYDVVDIFKIYTY